MRYLVRERLFDIKDDFWVTDERGHEIFYVNAKFLSLHHTLVLEDASGGELASIQRSRRGHSRPARTRRRAGRSQLNSFGIIDLGARPWSGGHIISSVSGSRTVFSSV
jgi:hypothetical protein